MVFVDHNDKHCNNNAKNIHIVETYIHTCRYTCKYIHVYMHINLYVHKVPANIEPPKKSPGKTERMIEKE